MMKKLLAFLALLGLLSFLNPPEAEHRDRFAASFRADHPVLSLFGADRVAPSLLTYRSYGVASAGWVGDELVTVGGVGMVHVRELDMDALGREAGARGEEGVREFLEGVREGVERGGGEGTPGRPGR